MQTRSQSSNISQAAETLVTIKNCSLESMDLDDTNYYHEEDYSNSETVCENYDNTCYEDFSDSESGCDSNDYNHTWYIPTPTRVHYPVLQTTIMQLAESIAKNYGGRITRNIMLCATALHDVQTTLHDASVPSTHYERFCKTLRSFKSVNKSPILFRYMNTYTRTFMNVVFEKAVELQKDIHNFDESGDYPGQRVTSDMRNELLAELSISEDIIDHIR
jgi:hypothetical protein